MEHRQLSIIIIQHVGKWEEIYVAKVRRCSLMCYNNLFIDEAMKQGLRWWEVFCLMRASEAD